jgi:hypothetical protein
MRVKSLVIHLLVLLIAAPPAVAGQRRESPEVWRTFAERLDAGAFVMVRLHDGTTMKGHVIDVAGDALRFKPKTRIPVAIRDLPFADIESIERQKPGLSPGSKVLIGIGVGAGAIFGGLLIFLAAVYD